MIFNTKYITIFSATLTLLLANISLCQAEEKPICDYAQFSARFGGSLDKGIQQLTGNGYKKNDVKITPLSGGMTSANLFIMALNGKKYVLRTLNARHSVDVRKQEILAHMYAAQIDIAPAILFVDNDFSFIIMPFISGHTLNSGDLKNAQTIKKIGSMISKLHNYTGDFTRRMTQIDRARIHYERALKKQVALPTSYVQLYENYISIGKKLAENKKEQVLCHADLNPSNILIREDGKIFFIDWTSATWGHQYTDLGYFAFINGLSNEQALLLVTAYLGKEPTNTQIEKFEHARQRTSFLTATVWLDYSESDQDKLIPFSQRVQNLNHLLMSKQLKTGNDYIKNNEVVSPISGNTEKIRLYALGFLKTYINWIDTQGD